MSVPSQQFRNTLIALVALLGATTANAQDKNWFAGVSVDHNNHEYFIDDKDRGWDVFAGRFFGRYFFVEAGYSDFGSFGYRSIPALGGHTSVELSSFRGAVGARFPIRGSKFSLGIEAGLHRWTRDYRLALSGGSQSLQSSDDGVDPWAALRLNYQISDQVQVFVEQAEYRLQSASDRDASISQTGAGVAFQF